MSVFLKIRNNESYKNALLDSLLSGISDNHVENLTQIFLYIIDEKFDLFNKDELKGYYYKDESDELLDLILPAIRRLYGKTFITPPSLFANESGPTDKSRFRLFVLYFNVDEFITYLVSMLIKCKGMLIHFDHIDKSVETLTLIVDNYIAGNVKKVRDCQDLETEIRKLEREFKIKDLLND